MKLSTRLSALTVIGVLIFSAAFAFAEDAPVAGMVNPMHEASADSVASGFGVNMTAPTFANSVSWFTYDGDPEIAEMRFTAGTQEYNYRAAKTGAQTDISGMYYIWSSQSAVMVDDLQGTLCLSQSGEGLVLWYDAQNGIAYSLSVNSGADADTLTKLAASVHDPADPVVVGAPTGTVTGCVTYADNSAFGLTTNGVSYDFLITSDTVVDCYSFDTGDYLAVEYSGYTGSALNALHVSKITVAVTSAPQPVATPGYIGDFPVVEPTPGYIGDFPVVEPTPGYIGDFPVVEPTPGYIGDLPAADPAAAPGYLGDEPFIIDGVQQ